MLQGRVVKKLDVEIFVRARDPEGGDEWIGLFILFHDGY
jgi:hypothetical protein